MSWLYIVIIAYLLNAIAMTTDKFLISDSIPEPVGYTFNIGILNGIAMLFLLPFGFFLIPYSQIAISLLAGISFAFALFFLYKSLKGEEVSRVSPYIGSLNPVFIFILAFFFLGERMTIKEIGAFILVIAGGILISWHFKTAKTKFIKLLNFIFKVKEKSVFKIFALATLSALFFASSYTLTKYIYNSTEFINGFIWTRIGLVLGVLILILPKANRKKVFHPQKNPTKKAGGIFLFGQICGGLSFFLINYAFSIKSVTIVQALQGLQYVFLFLIIITLSKKFPKILEEKLTPTILWQKILAIFIISGGLYLLII